MKSSMNPGGVRLQKARAMGSLMGKGVAGKPVKEVAAVPANSTAKPQNYEKGAGAWEKGTKMKGMPAAKSHPDRCGM